MTDSATKFWILHDLDGVCCDRCDRPISTGISIVVNGERITVGRDCAKHYGIVWSEQVGPMVNDQEWLTKALDIHRRHITTGKWPNGWDECLTVKNAIGSKAWKKCQTLAWIAYKENR